MNKIFGLTLALFLIVSMFYVNQNVYANPFFSNGYFTENGIEWCQENLLLYEILGDKFFEHHKHSLESRVCANLYQDYYWTYEGSDKVEKLIERSKHYSQLEILESYEESLTGIIDTTPAGNKDQTLLQGETKDGEIIVQLISSSPKINQAMEINLSFLDRNNRLVSDVNYGFEITQQNQQILKNNNIYSEKGVSTLITRPLNSEEPVLIRVSINGIGIPENQDDWTGPKGEVVMFTVVPEFGAMAIIPLAITVTVMIFLTTKKSNISAIK
ncbi:MAG: hypothetical protein IIA19_05440 [Thaumarchaeota archaeon]|nr:hypothetical protein [Nitrososphaerota archaeon]